MSQRFELAGVVLAAGRGQRLRPLTDQLPKPLCPIANRPLVDLALARISPYAGSGPTHLAVNLHHLPDLLRHHLGQRVTLSEEQPIALGTAGALGALRPWIDGRPVLLTNSDAYLPGGLSDLLDGWDGSRIRLLGKDIGRPADFGRMRYVGAALLPWRYVESLAAEPGGLYEMLWRGEHERGRLELVATSDVAIDCGTPTDYLAANLHASAGASVVGEGAVVEGRIERCVVWSGARVAPTESLVETIRAGTPDRPLTVRA